MLDKFIWSERRGKSSDRGEHDHRTPWDRDFARIIHSAAFRRLQSKTQVLGLGESDFYRTRLTHSLEVAQIAAGIVTALMTKKNGHHTQRIKKILPDPQLMAAIGLAHDLGHPPFGHGGEVALNYCMRDYGGFEGNGQTLRILSRLEKYSENDGLNPTRRLLLGILKYPISYTIAMQSKLQTPANEHLEKPSWLLKKEDCKPPKCYLDSEEEIVQWVLSPLNSSDIQLFKSYYSKKDSYNKSKFKSFDCEIMNLADDISYGVHDLEDALAMRLITKGKFEKEISNDNININDTLKDCNLDVGIIDDLFSKNAFRRKDAIGLLVNKFITNAEIIDKNRIDNLNFSDELLKYSIRIKEPYKKLHSFLLKIVHKHVIQHANVQFNELKGQKIICEIFEVLHSDPERFLHGATKKTYLKQDSDTARARVISDYISGMTDEYATKLYEKMFCPRRGSVFDKL